MNPRLLLASVLLLAVLLILPACTSHLQRKESFLQEVGFRAVTPPTSTVMRTPPHVAAATNAEASATTPTVMPTPPPAADPNHPVSSVPGESKEQRDARMGWWKIGRAHV